MEMPLIGKLNAEYETIIDRKNGTVKSATPLIDFSNPSTFSGGQVTSVDSYDDLKSNISYTYSETLERYEIHESTEDPVGLISLISKENISKLADAITFGDITASKVDGKELSALPVNLKLGKETIESARSVLAPYFPIIASVGDLEVSGLDLVITPYYDPSSYLIAQATTTGSLTVDFSGSLLEIKFSLKDVNSLSDDPLMIPEEIIKNAQLAEGFVDTVSGVKITTVISGKNAQFSVFDVAKKSAKKLTIPASVKVYGKTYMICTAHGKAFKKAKKLKTLIVKNKKLKKLLKKNPTKYGLNKNVKIK